MRSLSGVDAVGGGGEGHEVEVGLGPAAGAHGTADDEEYIRNIAMLDFSSELRETPPSSFQTPPLLSPPPPSGPALALLKICAIARQDIDALGADLWKEMSVWSTPCNSSATCNSSAIWRRLMEAVQKRDQCARADECRRRIERLHVVFGDA